MDSSRYNIREERRNIRRQKFSTECIVLSILASAMLISILIFICLYPKQNNSKRKPLNKPILDKPNLNKPNDPGKDDDKIKTNQIYKDPFDNNTQIEITCNPGYFIPSDDKSNNPQCIKCKTDNCKICYGTKNVNISLECKPSYEAKTGNGIIISCPPLQLKCEENEKCKKCENNQCIECYDGYYIPIEENIIRNNCLKCRVDNCKECNGTEGINNCYKCNSNLIPHYENDENKIIESCNTCEIGKDDKCLSCNNNMSSKCNLGYILNEGKCEIINYSFKVEYFTDKNNFNIPIINNNYIENIKNITIDNELSTTPNNNEFTFLTSGKHTIFFIVKDNYNNLNSLENMFEKNIYIKNIVFSELFNTENITNMNNMFSGCSLLTSINISIFNTSKTESMKNMFSGCSSLTSINISNFNTTNVKNMENMFQGCSSLNNINISNFNTTNTENMKNMFSDCSSLTSLNLKNFNTINIIDMSYLFYNCSHLNSIDLSNFNTKNTIYMNHMFSECCSLKNINISNFNTQNVKDMNNMFSNCFSLTSLNIDNFNTTNVENMSYMFHNCSTLSSIDISRFKTEKVSDMNHMFSECSLMNPININNFNTKNVKDMSYMFYNCSSLKKNYFI